MGKLKMTQRKLELMIESWQTMTKPALAVKLGISIQTLFNHRSRLIAEQPDLEEKLTELTSKDIVIKTKKATVSVVVIHAYDCANEINERLECLGYDASDVINIETVDKGVRIWFRS